MYIAPLSDDGLVSVDVGGCLRLWETSVVHLERSLQEWRNMIGYEDTRPLQVWFEDRRIGYEDACPLQFFRGLCFSCYLPKYTKN